MLNTEDIYADEEERRKQVCGCSNPYCTLPVEEEKTIIEEADEDYPPIAEGCKTKYDFYSGIELYDQVLASVM